MWDWAEENNEHQDYDERVVITEYFKKGFEYSAIVEMLEKEHSVTLSSRTLKSRLNGLWSQALE